MRLRGSIALAAELVAAAAAAAWMFGLARIYTAGRQLASLSAHVEERWIVYTRTMRELVAL